jgi:hypothetical protein
VLVDIHESVLVRRPALLASGAPGMRHTRGSQINFLSDDTVSKRAFTRGSLLNALCLFAVSESALFDGRLIRILMGFPLPLPECCREIGSGKRKSARLPRQTGRVVPKVATDLTGLLDLWTVSSASGDLVAVC